MSSGAPSWELKSKATVSDDEMLQECKEGASLGLLEWGQVYIEAVEGQQHHFYAVLRPRTAYMWPWRPGLSART